MATEDVRGRVIDGLVAAMGAHPDLIAVVVSPEWPGDTATKDVISLTDVRGISVEVPTFGTARLSADDHFTLAWDVQAWDRQTYADTRSRVLTMVNAIRDVCVNDPDLGGMDGLLWVLPQNVNGPLVIRTNEGRMGRATVELAAHCRID